MAVWGQFAGTRATIDGEDGASRNVTAVEIPKNDAAVLAAYHGWLSDGHMSRDLFCNACGPSEKVKVFVEPNQIALICNHRWLHYTGKVRVPRRRATPPAPHAGLVLLRVPDVVLTDAESLLLRQYKRLLERYGMREALWCNVCDEAGRAHGMAGYVTPTKIELKCRCVRLLSKGLSL